MCSICFKYGILPRRNDLMFFLVISRLVTGLDDDVRFVEARRVQGTDVAMEKTIGEFSSKDMQMSSRAEL
jgi:hypothetical protein